jgi:hypothetical protein
MGQETNQRREAAFAHAFLDHAVPGVGLTVSGPVREIRLYYTQGVVTAFSHVHFAGATGAVIKFTPPPNAVRRQNLTIAPRRCRRSLPSLMANAFSASGLAGPLRRRYKNLRSKEEVQRRGGDSLTPAKLVLLNETAKAAVIEFEDAAFPARVDCKARRDQRVRALCAFAARIPRRIRAGRRGRLPGRG